MVRLTAREVLDAFPEEARDIVYKINLSRKVDLAFYQSGMADIVESDYDNNTKMFLLKLWAFHIPKQLSDDINRLNLLLRLMNNKNSTILAEDVKHIPIESLHEFINPRKTSKTITAICPLHNEDSPSFYIYTRENKFHCYGCGAHGDVIDFIQKLHNLNFKQAINFLAR